MLSRLEFDGEICWLKNFPRRHFFTTARTKKDFWKREPASIDTALIIPKHSDIIVSISQRWREEYREKSFGCDGVITSLRNLSLALYAADCLPIMMSDEVNRKFKGLIHAGWRGTDFEVARKTVEAAIVEFNVKPEDIFVGIGPGIHKCCYSNPNIAKKFAEDRRWQPHISRNNLGIEYIDILDFNIKQLLDAKIKPDHIAIAAECTYCSKDKDKNPIFYSHYRSNDKGRNKIVLL